MDVREEYTEMEEEVAQLYFNSWSDLVKLLT